MLANVQKKNDKTYLQRNELQVYKTYHCYFLGSSVFWSDKVCHLRLGCHTEARRGRRITKTKQWKSRRHRRCIERRSLFANSISLNTKRLSQNSYQEFVRYTSVALCAVGTSVTLCVTSVPSVTPCAYYIRLLVYYSIFQKSHNLFLCHLVL